MDVTEFLEVCDLFAGLGDAVGSQLMYFAEGGRNDDQLNSNALKRAQDRFLREAIRISRGEIREGLVELNQEIEDYLLEYENGGTEDE